MLHPCFSCWFSSGFWSSPIFLTGDMVTFSSFHEIHWFNHVKARIFAGLKVSGNPQGGAPESYKWVIIPLTIDISPTKTIVIGLICTNLAIPNWGTTLQDTSWHLQECNGAVFCFRRHVNWSTERCVKPSTFCGSSRSGTRYVV